VQDSASAAAKHFAVTKLIVGVLQIKPPQERIGRQFRRAHQIAPAVSFGFPETQKLVCTSLSITPDPTVKW
jgi:hypothetical protein